MRFDKNEILTERKNDFSQLRQIEEADQLAERQAEEIQTKFQDAYQLEQELHETSLRVMNSNCCRR